MRWQTWWSEGTVSCLKNCVPQGLQQAQLQFAKLAKAIILSNAVGQALAPHGWVDQKPIKAEDSGTGHIKPQIIHDNLPLSPLY